MLKPGDKIELTYYEGDRLELPEKAIEWEESKPIIFNIRSTSFIKVELVE